MSVPLRVFLLVGAALVLMLVVRKLKKSEFEIVDSIFWLVLTFVLVMLAAFPEIAYACSSVLGFESASNFVFLAVIAILMMRVFMLNAKLAHLRAKVNGLIQEIALREKE